MSAAFWRLRSSSVSPGRSEDLLGDERRPVRPREREELLEQAHSAHEEVDVVDVALLVGPASLDLDLVGERLRLVRHEEEVVRGEPPEDECGEDAEKAEDDCGAGEALHESITTGCGWLRRRRR